MRLALLLSALLLGIPGCSPAGEPEFAREHVWSQEYWIRDDLKLGSEAETRERFDELLRRATEIAQDKNRADDTPCPMRFEASKVSYYSVGDPKFPGAGRKRGELVFPASGFGVYISPGPGPSFAAESKIHVWVEKAWGRVGRSAGWALIHEHGHLAGLRHLDVRRGAPCQLMSYGKFGNGCHGGRILRPFQCEAYKRMAQKVSGRALCLLEDPGGAPGWVKVAPAGTPCSDGSGTCNAKGHCIRKDAP